MREGREEKGEEICNNFRTLTWNANLCVQREGEKEWRQVKNVHYGKKVEIAGKMEEKNHVHVQLIYVTNLLSLQLQSAQWMQ